jgi:hypothetical protein
MTQFLIIGVVVIVAVGVIVLAGWRMVQPYKQVFSTEHHQEVAESIAALRETALSALDSKAEATSSDRNPAGVLTSAGLGLSYSIGQDRNRFVHHWAVSWPGRVTPHAVGDRFVYFACKFLQLPVERLFVGSTESTVHHGIVKLDDSEQQQFREAQPVRLTDEDVSTILKCYESASVQCQPMDGEDAA